MGRGTAEGESSWRGWRRLWGDMGTFLIGMEASRGQGDDGNGGDGNKQDIENEGKEVTINEREQLPEESKENTELPLWSLDLEALLEKQRIIIVGSH